MTALSTDEDVLLGEATEPAAVDVPAPRAPRRRRRALVAVLLAFVVTRGLAGYVADHPDFYGCTTRSKTDRACPIAPDPSGDVGRYDLLSWSMRHENLTPYGQALQMEYPPGAIPVMMIPRYVRAVSYHTEFVLLMVLFDGLGLVALTRIGRRTGSWWGAGTWFVLMPLLGPVTYTRLDLVVAVALVWAVERALAGRWGHVGLLVGVGTGIKLVPALLLPILFFVAPRDKRRRLVGGFAVVIAACIIPFLNRLPQMYDSVIAYHAERGVQAESLWGSGLLAARWVADYSVAVVPSHLAWDAASDVSSTVKLVSNGLTMVVLLGMLALALRSRVGDLPRASLLALGTMSLLVGVGRVYSPQYVVWIIGLAAAAMALAPRHAALATGVLAAVTVLSHIEFPIWFWDALFYDKGGALLVLIARNVLTVVVGVMAMVGWRRARGQPALLA